MTNNSPTKILTIAGSDSGGAAGLQADLRTFTTMGAYGLCAITAVTAQSSLRVEGVQPMPAAFVTAQLTAVLSDYGAAAAKCGFIGRVDVVEAIAATMGQYPPIPLVVDPVLVNHKGVAMFKTAVVDAYREHLFPMAALITPNLAEGALLTGLPVDSVAAMERVVKQLYALGPKAVLLKGGREGEQRIDLFFDGEQMVPLPTPHIETDNLHGSGDTLSAATAVLLGGGVPLLAAVQQAQALTAQAIKTAVGWRMGQGHGPVWLTAADNVPLDAL